MKLFYALLAGVGVLFGVIPETDGAVCRGQITLTAEMPTIKKAAERNGCCDDDFLLLLAIRKAENGRAGREFGVMHHKALDTDLDTQAGWAAATIVKNRKRWDKEVRTAGNGGPKPEKDDASVPGFIEYLGDRYCPASCDPEGNRNWKRNVRYWFEKFKGENQCQ